ncbi:uncharacterized protein LOC116619245 [Nematostella vectensis]|uniref:uncharacterized protein LOC116619245 n=1 Tax=Nematostella vectensis TaxID=45351 RepID=UPI0020771C03|nr:uncharacterized protein LOC116619245 [Nematostella vectensis]
MHIKILLGIVVLVLVIWERVNGFTGFTLMDRYLPGHVLESYSSRREWIQCTMLCQDMTKCVSYNFDRVSGVCELNDHGLRRNTDGEFMLRHSKDVVFHQLRPITKNKTLNYVHPDHQCDCRCPGQTACSPSTDPGSRYLPRSCRDAYNTDGATANGAYDIKLPPRSTRTRVYCHMEDIPGCGGGGWTLVMKIDGSMQTFTYNSPLWTSKQVYNENDGLSLDKRETKLSTYWGTPFNALCLGMTNNAITRWTRVDHTASSLYDVIKSGQKILTGLPVEKWKRLLDSSSLQTGCTLQGFNLYDSQLPTAASTRIGIIGFKNACNGTSNSRLGFGTSGDFYGMDKNNSCGNEARNGGDLGDVSQKAFGYILIQ